MGPRPDYPEVDVKVKYPHAPETDMFPGGVTHIPLCRAILYEQQGVLRILRDEGDRIRLASGEALEKSRDGRW